MKEVDHMWKPFPKHKPTTDGWYICTVEVKDQQRYVMMLYWHSKRGESGKFIDNLRESMFDMYDIYGCDNEKLTTCHLCDRTDGVVAFRKVPKSYMKGFTSSHECYQ